MRIYCSGDLHIRTSGNRTEEIARCLDWLAEDCAEMHPDVVVLAGDVFDRKSTPEERLVLARWLQRVSDETLAPIHIIPGNHDCVDDLMLFSDLDVFGPGVKVHTTPDVAMVGPEADPVRLLFVPFPRIAHLAAAMPTASIAERRVAARAALVDILRGLRVQVAGPLPSSSLLVYHGSITGAALDSGQTVSGGDELSLSVGDLMEAGPGAIVLSHIHVRQQLAAPVPCWYTGSIARCNFGESNGPKGALVYEWTGAEWRVEKRNGPARRMLLVECRWTGGDDAHLDGEVDPEECQDAEIRVRVEFPSDEREAARAAVADVRRTLEETGAHSVTVEERPVVVQRTRCSEIAAARTVVDKLAAWAQATGLEVPQSIAEKLAALEEGS